jgi:hypothetical protein
MARPPLETSSTTHKVTGRMFSLSMATVASVSGLRSAVSARR